MIKWKFIKIESESDQSKFHYYTDILKAIKIMGTDESVKQKFSYANMIEIDVENLILRIREFGPKND